MNFATFMQQGGSNGQPMQQMMSMVGGASSDGVQYVQPQLISVPIALPGSKPGDPQPTVQIQVLNPGLLQQPPKYQMQIPIQGFQQGAVLTLAYSPEDAGSFQLISNTLPEGVQLLMPQDMQMVQQEQPDSKEQVMQQVYITPDQQILINPPPPEQKPAINNNTCNNNNNPVDIVIKEECDVDENVNDVDESSQGTEESEKAWQTNTSGHADLLKYLNTLQPQQTQALPVSLQQFLRMNTDKKAPCIQVEIQRMGEDSNTQQGDAGEVVEVKVPKKKKYKKRPTKPARPKPGQVVIVQAADGTPIYCCPECQMAYPEKEQLEMHLSVHRIERRFICGICGAGKSPIYCCPECQMAYPEKEQLEMHLSVHRIKRRFICGICGAGLKRKEHLERHKLGHNPERPYVCSVCHKGFKRREHLNLHEVIHSGVKTEMCGECGKGFYRKDHLRKHTRSHETRRLREDPAGDTRETPAPTITNSIMPEITIHVPTSDNMQPVQIHIPQHVVNSLQQQNQQSQQATLDALLQQRT